MTKIFVFMLIFAPAFAHATDPCASLEANFLGTFSVVKTESESSVEKTTVEIIKWSNGSFTLYYFEKGRRSSETPIAFGQSYAHGQAICVLNLVRSDIWLTNKLADLAKGHFVFIGRDPQINNSITMDFSRSDLNFRYKR